MVAAVLPVPVAGDVNCTHSFGKLVVSRVEVEVVKDHRLVEAAVEETLKLERMVMEKI